MMKQTKHTNVEKKKPSEVMMTFVIVGIIIMIFLGIGAFIKTSVAPKKEISNGFTFTKQGNFWYTEIKNPYINQVYSVEFRFAPSEVKDIPVVGNPSDFFKLLQINNLTGAYLTFDPMSNLSGTPLVAADLARNMNSIHGVTLIAACTRNETDACKERPIVTCENQLNNAVVIYIKQSETPGISMVKNCLTVEGQGVDLLKANTKLLFLLNSII